ncbi:hypothetical protein KUTeg_004449 [Tegillarca granosa]|uniref:medium-chain acyl-CoA ligase n=1 Tax=Tegillarca granosa TaxID=220873 RepID=A0ABQ9FQ28_TEGGR|nr:hypothetical protein KUTeg_004449 [Tegillarca granosa]
MMIMMISQIMNYTEEKWWDLELLNIIILPGIWLTDGQHLKRAANVLRGACDLQIGDKLVIILPRIPQWWTINVGAIRAAYMQKGWSFVSRDEAKKREFNRYYYSYLRDGWLNYDELMESASDEFQTCNTKASDPMTLFFTSGTTGAPKMTEHTHASYGYGHYVTAKYMLNCKPNDIIWALADTGWAKCAWSCLFAPWIAGSCVFVHHSERFDPERTLNVLQKYPVSHFCAPPTAYRLMVKQPLKNYSIQARHCIGAGEPLNPELLDWWKEGTGLMLYEGFGQTETTFLCGTYPCVNIRPGSMGKAAPGIDIEDDEKRTKSVHQGEFYLTGDRAIMDEDRYIWFVGRADDVILTAGYRVGPFEVESALIEHPSVIESAAVSSPDKDRGEVVKAFIVLGASYQDADKEKLTKELQDHVKSVTAPYKYPRKIEFVTQLPKTVSGKIRRVELRNKEWNRPIDHKEADV